MSIKIWEVLSILFIHWIADFIMQTGWQATNKSKRNDALLYHTISYSLIWLLPVSCMLGLIYGVYFVVITLFCHTITDFITSRINTKLWKENKVHLFFVSIGFDQFLHFIQLIISYTLLGSAST